MQAVTATFNSVMDNLEPFAYINEIRLTFDASPLTKILVLPRGYGFQNAPKLENFLTREVYDHSKFHLVIQKLVEFFKDVIYTLTDIPKRISEMLTEMDLRKARLCVLLPPDLANEQMSQIGSVAQNRGLGHSYFVEDVTRAFNNSIYKAIKEASENGLPVAKYDFEKRLAYLEYPCGKREYQTPLAI